MMPFVDTPNANGRAAERSVILRENQRLIRKCNTLYLVIVMTYIGLAAAACVWGLSQAV